MNVGFIGTGNMGGILIEALIKSRALQPAQIIAANRTFEKAEIIAARHPGLKAVRTNTEAALGADLLFVCVKPRDFKEVLDEIKEVVMPDQLVVSITSPVLIRHLENQLPCKVAKMIPSITNYVCSGATLVMYGRRVGERDVRRLENLLAHISKPMRVSEDFARVCSDLSSCGPAFLSFFVERFVQAAVDCTGIPKEEAERLAAEMVLGTGLLLTAGGFSPETLRKTVTVPGGITAEGLRMLSMDLDGTFERLIRSTHLKYREELEKVEGQFYKPAP